MKVNVLSPDDMYDWLLLLDPFTNMWADSVALMTVRDMALDVGQGEYSATECAMDAHMYGGMVVGRRITTYRWR